jgi:hypothetical protein
MRIQVYVDKYQNKVGVGAEQGQLLDQDDAADCHGLLWFLLWCGRVTQHRRHHICLPGRHSSWNNGTPHMFMHGVHSCVHGYFKDMRHVCVTHIHTPTYIAHIHMRLIGYSIQKLVLFLSSAHSFCSSHRLTRFVPLIGSLVLFLSSARLTTSLHVASLTHVSMKCCSTHTCIRLFLPINLYLSSQICTSPLSLTYIYTYIYIYIYIYIQLIILLIWGLVSCPLVLLGTIVGRNLTKPYVAPCRVTQVCTHLTMCMYVDGSS